MFDKSRCNESTFMRLDNSNKFVGKTFDKTDTIQFQSTEHAIIEGGSAECGRGELKKES